MSAAPPNGPGRAAASGIKCHGRAAGMDAGALERVFQVPCGWQLLELAAQGHSNAEIACMHFSP